jgi:DnaK suppressor protein
MTREQLLLLKEKLVRVRKELLNGVDNVNRHSNDEFHGEIPDVNDEANRTYNRQVILSIGEVDRQQLKLVEESLELIGMEDGDYGTCIDCEEEIPFERLEAAPYVMRCIGCKTKYEEMTSAEEE